MPGTTDSNGQLDMTKKLVIQNSVPAATSLLNAHISRTFPLCCVVLRIISKHLWAVSPSQSMHRKYMFCLHTLLLSESIQLDDTLLLFYHTKDSRNKHREQKIQILQKVEKERDSMPTLKSWIFEPQLLPQYTGESMRWLL